MKSYRIIASSCILLGCTLLLLSCDTSVDPILDAGRPYTMWGFLDVKADTQFVRVIEIADTLDSISPDSLEAVFTSLDMSTGEETMWKQKIVEISDNDFRHIFYSDLRIKDNRRYRLEIIRRSDLATSHVELRVPALFSLIEQSAIETDTSIIAPVFLTGDPPNVFHTRVVYEASTIPVNPGLENPIVHDVTISYADKRVRFNEGWIIDIDLTRDFKIIQQTFRRNIIVPNDLIFLRNMKLIMVIGNEAWDPPGGEFDPELLVEPGTFSNIESGFGFIGAGYEESVTWRPARRPLLLAGFANCRPGIPDTICTKADLPSD